MRKVILMSLLIRHYVLCFCGEVAGFIVHAILRPSRDFNVTHSKDYCLASAPRLATLWPLWPTLLASPTSTFGLNALLSSR